VPAKSVSSRLGRQLQAFCLRKSERSMSATVSLHSDWGT
jgi:hypothetical protein